MGDHILGYIPTKRQAPFAYVRETIAGNGEIRIYAGKYLEVPNVYELIAARLVLTTDATVANREVQIRCVTEVLTVLDHSGDAVAASSAATHQIHNINYASNFSTAPFLGLGRLGITLQGDSEHLYITVTNGVAGDLLEARLVFRWLNWELGMEQPEMIARWFRKQAS